MLSRENVEWADEKTNYKRLLNDSYISNWSYEKWYPKGTYIDAKILIFFSLFIFRLKSYAFTFRAIQNSVGFLIFFLFWFSSTFFPAPLQWLYHSIPPTKKNKINVNVKWRCCFYTITYKSFAFPQKIVFKTVKNFVDGKPVFFLSFTTLVPCAIYLPNRCEWKATRNCSIFYPKCWRRLCCHTRKCKGNKR